MKKILVTKKTDGSVGVTDLTHLSDGAIEREIFRVTYRRILDENLHVVSDEQGRPMYEPKPGIVSWRLVDRGAIPSDRRYRGAWTDDNPTETVDVHMDKARDIQMQHIRRARDNALAKLDIETLKGNDVQKEKQVLRDIPQNFDLTKAKTPEALKGMWSTQLDREEDA